MSTLADLIRAHERNPRALYVPEKSDRVSAPGHYKETASQRSPALDRRVEKLTARKLGEDMGLDPDDLDKIDDLEDLNDLLNGVDPDLPDVDDPEFPDPEDPELPDPEDPETPDLPLEPPMGVDGLIAYALHSGSISISETGGATWAQYSGSPSDPIGFSVMPGGGIYVATSSSVGYSEDLRTWRELPVLGEKNLQISGFRNGDFEGGLSGWDVISMLAPITGQVDHVLPSHGSSYLRRNWIVLSDGEFEVAQIVTLTPAEMSALGDGGALSFSGDVFGDGGAGELRLERNVEGVPYFRATDRVLGDDVNSDLLNLITITGTEDLPDNVTAARIAFDHSIVYPGAHNISGPHDIRFFFRIFLLIDGIWRTWSHAEYYAEDVPDGAGLIRLGQFTAPFSATLTSSSYPGTITLNVPVGWKYPIDNYIGGGGPHDRTSSTGYSDTFSYSIGWGTGWITMASASRSEFTWGRIAAEVGSVPTNELRCVIKVTGSPADAYVDNCRLEVVREPEAVEVTAIGGKYVAIGGSLYSMSPEGLTLERALEFDPTGIAPDGSLAWGGGSIFIADEEQTYSIPYTIVRAFPDSSGPVLLTSGDEIWRRNDDPELPGWETLASGKHITDLAPMLGTWGAMTDSGDGFPFKTSDNLAVWRNGPTADIKGKRIAVIGQMVTSWDAGEPWFYWLNYNGWRFGGNLKSGIIDISSG